MKLTPEERIARQEEALSRATQNTSLINYPTIIQEFMNRGIPASEISPRENVFTFNAWKALGRYVRKGEKGVKVISMKVVERDNDGEKEYKKLFTSAYVFHISQTEQPI